MSKTFCPLLFQHLATHPHGGCTHCCIVDHHNAMGSSRDQHKYFYNLNRDTVHDVMNSESYRTARLQVLQEQEPPACWRCYDDERRGVRSKRQDEIEHYPDYTVEHARSQIDEHGYIANVQLDFVELRLGNICNAACRTCNPASSSKWVQEYQELQNKVSFDMMDYSFMNGFRWPEREEFWDDLLQHCDNVKTFYINGGEPTLIKQHFAFLQKLIDRGRTNIKLWYNTNMTNMNADIIELWRKFDNVKVSFSIDDLAERNYYIRYPSDWSTIMTNVDMLVKEDFEIDITQTVSFMNYSNLSNFYRFFKFDRGIDVHLNPVYIPDYLSPAVLPKEMRDRIHETFPTDYGNVNEFEHLKKLYSGPDQPEQWQKAIEYTRALDNIRNQKIGDYLPEFKLLIG